MQLVSYWHHAGTDEHSYVGVEHASLVVDVAPLRHGNDHEVTARQVLVASSSIIESVIKQARELLEAGPGGRRCLAGRSH